MMSASDRISALAERLERFVKGRDAKLTELKEVVDKAAKAEAEAKDDGKAKAAKATNEAREKLQGWTKRYDDAAKILADAKGATGPPHAVISAWEIGADEAIGEAVPGRRADVWIFGTLSKLLLLLGLLAGLVYFYFSIEQKGPVGKVSRFGIWVLMIGFGASFGYTVQGRISLAIGRVLDINGSNKDPQLAAQINGVTVALISIAIIVAGLVVWELGQRGKGEGGPTDDGDNLDDGPRAEDAVLEEE